MAGLKVLYSSQNQGSWRLLVIFFPLGDGAVPHLSAARLPADFQPVRNRPFSARPLHVRTWRACALVEQRTAELSPWIERRRCRAFRPSYGACIRLRLLSGYATGAESNGEFWRVSGGSGGRGRRPPGGGESRPGGPANGTGTAACVVNPFGRAGFAALDAKRPAGEAGR